MTQDNKTASVTEAKTSSTTTGSSSFLRALQHWSGVAFSVFASLHVATTVSASVSPATYDLVLEKTRGIYRPNMMMEGLVVFAPLVVHMIANSLIFMSGKKSTATANTSLAKKLHTYTGYALGALVPMHIFGTRFMHSYAGSFASIAFAAEKEIGQGAAMGYFGLLLTSGVYHSIYGLNVALGYKLKKPVVLASIVAVLAASYYGALGLLGYLYPDQMVAVRAKYDQFAH
ncbi:predicted protein [Naegleria gruberi]|uniref:Predicted protein n=1 Tax=Naegleria gruberi TaxID=5762 RepID=D2UZ68_NAEGR|nr:uncharacterized protein NAEGRDRAFT_61830 [Naegleria gruberi]EFC50100.1 predicted protein [Naegleria gruberi]|eukprot:XP_002682844.1 predicted protein [Naegleria gruberi strain NEG-M]